MDDEPGGFSAMSGGPRSRAGLARADMPVTLSENERLLVACVRRLARAIADGARGLTPADAEQYIALEVFDIIESLGGLSDAFAIETARYLTDAVRRLRQN
jgi:hypothetical protein